MERTQFCPDCKGTGSGPPDTDFDASLLWMWRPRCFTCDGRGLLEGNAIVHVRGAGSDLVTEDYIWKFFHIARCFLDGWEAYQYRYPDRHIIRKPSYADIREYLAGFDADLISICQVALYLDPARVGPNIPYQSFGFTAVV